MPAQLIDGKSLAAATRRQVAAEIAALTAAGKLGGSAGGVHLAAILVGDSPAARVYAENQAKTCAQVNIRYSLRQLPSTTSQQELHQLIHTLNADPSITGIFLHSPLPNNLNLQNGQYQIDLLKDVEGVNPANIGHVVYGHTIIAPCAAAAVIELIDSTGTPLQGADVTVVGASRLIGRPLSLLLTERNATVTLCHIHTKDTPAACRNADIVVVAVGKPNLVRAEHIKAGAVIIDVGINRRKITDAFGKVTEKTVGDVDFEPVSQKASWITPVPGGVGPMTVAMLLKNTLRAAKLVHGLEKPFGSTPHML